MEFSILWREGGPIMPIILAAALAGYVLACERLLVWGLWRLGDGPLYRAESAGALEVQLNDGTARSTPLRELLRVALGCRSAAPDEREKSMELAILGRLPAVEARIATIGWLGSILPMLGLLGTVSGMIATFRELAFSSSRQLLSQGLSEALWTTEVGLLGAIPLLAVHHLLTRLKSRWLNRLELNLALLLGSGAEGKSDKA